MTDDEFRAIEEFANGWATGIGTGDVSIERDDVGNIEVIFDGMDPAADLRRALGELPPGAKCHTVRTRWYCESGECEGSEDRTEEHWFPEVFLAFYVPESAASSQESAAE